MAFSNSENEPRRTPPSTLDPEEHTEKRSAGRAGEHKGRERGQASGKVSFFLGVRLPFVL